MSELLAGADAILVLEEGRLDQLERSVRYCLGMGEGRSPARRDDLRTWLAQLIASDGVWRAKARAAAALRRRPRR